jgi:hypothetical protein
MIAGRFAGDVKRCFTSAGLSADCRFIEPTAAFENQKRNSMQELCE